MATLVIKLEVDDPRYKIVSYDSNGNGYSNVTFSAGDRFEYKFTYEGIENPTGTVLYKRDGYDNSSDNKSIIKYNKVY